MDFRGTYTPLHAFREAYAKARAIGVELADSSSSSEDEVLMPSPRTGLRRATKIELGTEQRLEKMETSQEIHIMSSGASPRGTLSPRPPSSTGRNLPVARVTAFTPKAFVPIRQGAIGRLSSPADQHQSPAQIKQAEPAEAGSPAIVSAAKDGKPIAGKDLALAAQAGFIEQPKNQSSGKSSSVVEQSSNTGILQLAQEADGPTSIWRTDKAVPLQSSEEPFRPAMPFRPAAVSSEPALVPSGPSQLPIKSAAVAFRPAAAPFKSTAVPYNPAAVPFKPADSPSTLAVGSVQSVSVPFRPASVPFRPVTTPSEPFSAPTEPAEAPVRSPAVLFRPASVPFKPAAMPAQLAQAGSTASEAPSTSAKVSSRSPPEPFQSTAVPFRPAAAPLDPAADSTQPAQIPSTRAAVADGSPAVPLKPVAEPSEPAEVPFAPSNMPTEAAASTKEPQKFSPSFSLLQQSAVPKADLEAASCAVMSASTAAKAATSSPSLSAVLHEKAGLLEAPTAAATTDSGAGSTVKVSADNAASRADSKAGYIGKPSADKAESQAVFPVTPLASTIQPKADLLMPPLVLKAGSFAPPAPEASLPVTPSASKAASSPMPSAQKASLPAVPPVPKAGLKAGSASKSEQASQQAGKPIMATQAVSGQANVSPLSPANAASHLLAATLSLSSPDRMSHAADEVPHASAGAASHAPLVEVAASSIKCDELEELDTAEQASSYATEVVLNQQQLFSPRARKPIVFAMKGLSLGPASAQVASPASDSSHQLIAMQQAGPKQSQHGQAQKASPEAAMGALSLKAQVPKLDLGKVTPVAVSVTPPAKTSQPASGARTLSPSVTPPAVSSTPSAAVTPPPRRTPPGALQLGSKSVSKKPPLHPKGSPLVTCPKSPASKAAVTPPTQPSTSGCDQSSASPKPAAKAASQAAAQGAETAVVAPAGLPRRVPLSSKGMSSQNWAARQHKKASRGARQALAFLYPKGFPWLPEAEQLAYVAASAPAATAVAHVSAQSGEISAAAAARTLHFPAGLPVNQSQLLDQSTGGNVMRGIYDPKAQQQDDPIAAAALHQGHRAIGAPPGTSEAPQSLSQGSSGILGSFAVDPRAVSAEPASPPAAGRRSEGGVGGSTSVMLDDSQSGVPDSQSGVPDSHRHPVLVTTQRGTVLETDLEDSHAKGKPSPLLMRPPKTQLVGSPSVQSPRGPWEIKASAAPASSSLATRYASTPGLGAGPPAASRPGPQDPMTAALSKKSQQRRAHKLAKHSPTGRVQSKQNSWVTAVVLVVLCCGGGLLLAPDVRLPAPVAKWQATISGAAKEAAWKLSPLVPATLHPADCRLTDVLSWEQQITKGPVQVWHQATSALLSLLPHSFLTHQKLHHQAAPPKQAEAPEAAANSGKWLSASFKSGWQNPWQMCVRVAEALPSLVPDVAQEAGLNRERDLVGSDWAQHAVAAPEKLWQQWASQKLPQQESVVTHSENGRQQAQKLSRYLSRVPQFGSDLIRQTGWWLLGGLESVMNLAGLDSDAERPQTGTPFLPDCAAEEHPSEPSAELEQSVREPVSQSAGAQGELAMPQAEPAVAQADLAVAQAEPALAQAEPRAAIAQPVSKTSSQGEQQNEITSPTGRQDMTANDVEAKTAEAKQAAASHDRAENTELDSVKAELEALERAHEVEDTTQAEQWPAGGGATWQDDAGHSAAEPVTIGNSVQGDVPPEESTSSTNAKQTMALDSEAEITSEPETISQDSSVQESPQSADSDSEPLDLTPESSQAELELARELQPGTPVSEPEVKPDSNPLSHVSQSKLQDLVTWLSDRRRFNRPAESASAAQHPQHAKQTSSQLSSQLSEEAASAVRSEYLQTGHMQDSGSLAAPTVDDSPLSTDDKSWQDQSEQHVSLDPDVKDGQTYRASKSPSDQSADSASDHLASSVLKQALKTAAWSTIPAAILLLTWLLWRHQTAPNTGLSHAGSHGFELPAVEEEEEPAQVESHQPAQEEEGGFPEIMQEGGCPTVSVAQRASATAKAVLQSVGRAASQATRSGLEAVQGSASGSGQEAESALEGSQAGPMSDAPEGSRGAGSLGRARKPKMSRELAGLEGGSEVRTPRTRKRPQRFTIDSYDARSKDIPKLHSLDSLSPNVDTLGLRNRSVLTLSRSEAAAASKSRELQSLQ